MNTTDRNGSNTPQVAPPNGTPWRSRNSRLDAPGSVHLTLFHELGNGAQP